MFEILIDECLPYSLKHSLIEHSIDARHVRDVGLRGASDRQILDYVKQNKCVLITRDLDFANILEFPISEHNGIIVLRLPNEFNSKKINEFCDQLFTKIDKSDYLNRLVIADTNKIRIRT